jgi:hypothetical protein
MILVKTNHHCFMVERHSNHLGSRALTSRNGARHGFSWCRHLELLCLAIKLPLVGVTWRGEPATHTNLWTISDRQCIEPSDRCWLVPSHYIGWHSSRLPFHGVRSAWDGPSTFVLTARVPGGLDLLWRCPLWWLRIFFQWSCYVRSWWDESRYTSACCRSCVGARGYIPSCLALNGAASWGSQHQDHLPSTENRQAWL